MDEGDNEAAIPRSLAGVKQNVLPGWFAAALALLPMLLVLVVVLGVFGSPVGRSDAFLGPPSLLLANTPTGGDVGAHVLLPKVLAEGVLASGRILGWSGAWFAGYPVLFFYFPLPMYAAVLLDVVLPYGVALKLVVVGGVLALPGAAFFLVRRLTLSPVVAAFGAMGAAAFLLMESYAIFGGNIKSTLAGEFAFSWSLALGFVYLALLLGDSENVERAGPLPGIILALVTLAHIVSTVVFVFASAVLLSRPCSRRAVVRSWLIGFGLSAFWAIPFASGVVSGLTTDLKWSPVTGLVGDESPLPVELLPVVAAALIALPWLVRRTSGVAFVVGLGFGPLLLYLVGPQLGLSAVNNGRFLPYWYLAVSVVGGVGLGLLVDWVGGRFPQSRFGTAVLASLLALLFLVYVTGKVGDVPHWVNWSFTGYEEKSRFPEYRDLMEVVDGLPPGRVAWEDDERVYAFGTDLALMLLPYWTDTHPSMAGLYYESSLTTPFNLLNASELSAESSGRIPTLSYRGLDVARGLKHLEVFGVRYYIASTDEAKASARQAGLDPIAESGMWTIYPASEGELVVPATSEPSVWGGPGDFVEASLEWYGDVDHLDRWLVKDGPESWRRVASVAERLDGETREYEITDAAVSDVIVEDYRISFRTEAVGVPHMVRVSYFPNWTAHGAEGPFRAAPSLMVVVPTSEEVVLTFDRSWEEYAGMGVTLFTIVALVVLGYRTRRSRAELKRDDTEEMERSR